MLFTMTNKERLWSWAIYVGLDAKGLVHVCRLPVMPGHWRKQKKSLAQL